MDTKKKIYILITLFTIVTVSLVAFLVYPTVNTIHDASEEILAARGQVIFAQMESRQLGSFQKDLKEYETHFSQADTFLVDAKNPIDFIKFLEKTAGDSGMTAEINLVPMSNQVAPGDSPQQFFNIHARGNFANALLLLKKVENGNYLVTIENIKLQKFDDPSQPIDSSKKKNARAATDVVDLDVSLSALSTIP